MTAVKHPRHFDDIGIAISLCSKVTSQICDYGHIFCGYDCMTEKHAIVPFWVKRFGNKSTASKYFAQYPAFFFIKGPTVVVMVKYGPLLGGIMRESRNCAILGSAWCHHTAPPNPGFRASL